MNKRHKGSEEGNDELQGATRDQSDNWKPEEKPVKDGLDHSWKIVLTNKPPDDFPFELLDENGELNLNFTPVTEEEFIELSRSCQLQKIREEAQRIIKRPPRDYVQ